MIDRISPIAHDLELATTGLARLFLEPGASPKAEAPGERRACERAAARTGARMLGTGVSRASAVLLSR